MTATFPLTLLPDPRGAVLAARGLSRTGVDFAARGDGVLSRRGEALEVIPLAGGRSVVALLDAKGAAGDVSAALDDLRGCLREAAPAAPHLGALLGAADVFAREHRGVLARGVVVALDPARHAFRYAVAGGVAPFVVGRSGDVVRLTERGPALGLVSGIARREVGPLRLAPGHLFLACTEGLLESVRDDGTTFGEAGLGDVLHRRRDDRPRAVVRDVLRAAAAWGGCANARPRTAFAFRLR